MLWTPCCATRGSRWSMPGSKGGTESKPSAETSPESSRQLHDSTGVPCQSSLSSRSQAEQVTQALARSTYQGLAMTYKSDGKGNMAHSAVIICYDGLSRLPKVVKRYDNIDGVL